MKIIFLIITLISLSMSSCYAGCLGKQKPKISGELKPIIDREIGKTESEILHKYGNPNETILMKAKELLIDEVRASVKGKIPGESNNVMVREFVYQTENSVRFFWLIKMNSVWKVISDIEIPNEIVF